MSVMSLRLSKEEIVRISKLSAQKKEGKSKVVRELLQEGWILHWLKLYRAGKVSIGKMAETIKNSIKNEHSTSNRKIAQKIYNIRGKKFLLRVVYKETGENEVEIITAYLTTRINKYLKR